MLQYVALNPIVNRKPAGAFWAAGSVRWPGEQINAARWLSGVGAGLLSGVGAWGSSNENALYDVHRGHDVELRSSLRADLRPFRPSPKSLKEYRKRLTRGRRLKVDVLRRAIPVVRTPDGLRALSGGRPISPTSVQRYLQGKFGERLAAGSLP
jgi:hypothetical protein